MTTPSVQISTYETYIANYQRQYIPNPTGWNNVAANVPYGTATFRKRPASTSNPIRADGTRARRSWAHQWRTSKSVYTTINITGPLYRYRGSIPGMFVNQHVQYAGLTSGALWLDAAGAPFPLSVSNRAKTKLFNKMLATPQTRRSRDSTNLGESLAELRQANGLVTQLATSLVKAVGGLGSVLSRGIYQSALDADTRVVRLLNKFEGMSRGEATAAARALAGRRGADIVQYWLAYQFGVKPLVNDIHNSASVLSDVVNRDRELDGYTFTVRAGAEEIDDRWIDVASNVPGMDLRLMMSTVSRAHYSMTVGCPVPNGALYESLGFSNPYSTAWNIMRFSWLADYALGMGSWLESLTPALNQYANWSFKSGSLSLLQYGVTTDHQWTPKAGYSGTCSSMGGSLSGGRFERTIMTGFPIPAYLPSLKKGLGVRQLANALSALTVLAAKR